MTAQNFPLEVSIVLKQEFVTRIIREHQEYKSMVERFAYPTCSCGVLRKEAKILLKRLSLDPETVGTNDPR